MKQTKQKQSTIDATGLLHQLNVKTETLIKKQQMLSDLISEGKRIRTFKSQLLMELPCGVMNRSRSVKELNELIYECDNELKFIDESVEIIYNNLPK